MIEVKILCHVLEDDDAVITLVKEQLLINEVEAVIFYTDEDFIKALTENVHLCIIDFLPSTLIARNGTQLTKIILDKYRESKVIVITGFNDAVDECEHITEFFHSGGFRWLRKDNSQFVSLLTDYVQAAIHMIKENIELKKKTRENAGTVVRDRPEKLSNESIS